MPKARELTEVEKFYIENNLDKSDSEIASAMKGIGAKTVCKYRESVPTKIEPKATETDEERADRLSSMDTSASFATKSGSVVMTQQASEISDAKKRTGKTGQDNNHERVNKGRIHRPRG